MKVKSRNGKIYHVLVATLLLLMFFSYSTTFSQAYIMDNLEFWIIHVPVAGRPIPTNIKIASQSPGVQVTESYWTVMDDYGNYVKPGYGEYFYDDKRYAACFHISLLIEGDEFDPVNGQFTINKRLATSVIGNKSEIKIYVPFVAIKEIEDASITGIQVPQIGEKINISASNVKAADTPEQFTVITCEWYEHIGGETPRLMNVDEEFRVGYRYYCKLELEPTEKYAFKAENRIERGLANGTYPVVILPGSAVVRNRSAEVRFERLEQTGTKISKVRLTDAPFILFDRNIQDALGSVKIEEDGSVRFKEVKYKTEKGNYLTQQSTFLESERYCADIYIEALGDYVFKDKSFAIEISQELQDKRYYLATHRSDYVEIINPKLAKITLGINPKQIASHLDVIYPVSVEPVEGEPAMFDEFIYHVSTITPRPEYVKIQWKEGNRDMKDGDVFTKGQKATLGVLTKLNNSSIFALAPHCGTKLTFNHEPVSYKIVDDKILMLKTFDVKAPSYEDPGYVENAGDTWNQPDISILGVFSDVPLYSWYNEYVAYVYNNNIMNGVGNGKFAPQANVSRAMIVTMLYRIAGEPGVGASGNFSDNTGNTWYTNAVKWTAQKGLAKDFIKGKFDPNKHLTREQMITIMYHYHKSTGKSTDLAGNLNEFKDANQISAYAQNPMKWAVKAGIIQGNEQKKLNPTAKVTRAEVAAIIQRFNQR